MQFRQQRPGGILFLFVFVVLEERTFRGEIANVAVALISYRAKPKNRHVTAVARAKDILLRRPRFGSKERAALHCRRDWRISQCEHGRCEVDGFEQTLIHAARPKMSGHGKTFWPADDQWHV